MKVSNMLLITAILCVVGGCSQKVSTEKASAADPNRCRVQCHLFYRDMRAEVMEEMIPPSEKADVFIDFDFNKKPKDAPPQVVQLPKAKPMYQATIFKRGGEFVLEIRNSHKGTQTDAMICETSFDIETIRERHPAGERGLSGLTYVPHPTVEGLELQFICTLKPVE
ncbi:hypothetical protein [Neorhodopirellula pilleata]|uniref:Lipoprotein n=1 Tax=Neorhodopirellula pilleata TaxID=2714738 RepID=A0A5C5ZKY4_9BACT|nr:hypothetical protein [Neorhodopirellula pilleata]TWT87838.1 hypothetical protein Pla100_58770 [Neorhodopirellula pilleata]